MKVFTFYVNFSQSFYVLRKNGPKFLRSMEKSPKDFTYYVISAYRPAPLTSEP